VRGAEAATVVVKEAHAEDVANVRAHFEVRPSGVPLVTCVDQCLRVPPLPLAADGTSIDPRRGAPGGSVLGPTPLPDNPPPFVFPAPLHPRGQGRLREAEKTRASVVEVLMEEHTQALERARGAYAADAERRGACRPARRGWAGGARVSACLRASLGGRKDGGCAVGYRGGTRGGVCACGVLYACWRLLAGVEGERGGGGDGGRSRGTLTSAQQNPCCTHALSFGANATVCRPSAAAT
jgi:hypothetical protein